MDIKKTFSAKRFGVFRRLKPSIAKASPTNGKHRQSSSFFNLPAEIREHIYQMVISETGRLHIAFRSDSQQDSLSDFYCFSCQQPWNESLDHVQCHSASNRSKDILRLLRVCRQVHDEALHVLYAQMHFSFMSRFCFILFAMASPPSIMNSMRYLSINSYTGSTTSGGLPQLARLHSQLDLVSKHIPSMRGLKTLYITINLGGDDLAVTLQPEKSPPPKIEEAAGYFFPQTEFRYYQVHILVEGSGQWWRICQDEVTRALQITLEETPRNESHEIDACMNG
ncbi:hypothetical protein BDV96DRAFT_648495 [Lophiotrema nucula]|uniref:DUF7730 domain-containing protein n=1 Tax=Lophiotrema nucula TaxID=690887 RepID=A0A6A5Z380_9PLEO|nr:hypothetical protein BDV96DRAFT_648495 [Lophiotrema nucula]